MDCVGFMRSSPQLWINLPGRVENLATAGLFDYKHVCLVNLRFQICMLSLLCHERKHHCYWVFSPACHKRLLERTEPEGSRWGKTLH